MSASQAECWAGVQQAPCKSGAGQAHASVVLGRRRAEQAWYGASARASVALSKRRARAWRSACALAGWSCGWELRPCSRPR
eukprot:3401663-Prymnesium_polylepis.1